MEIKKILKYIIRLSVVLPFAYWLIGSFQGWLGVEPIVKINTQSGYVVLILLLVNLLIGAIFSFNFEFKNYLRFLYLERRYIGIANGLYVILHFFTYLGKESFLPKGWTQIVTKNYLLAGSISAIILLILTLTSNDLAVRKLKKNWKKLHRLVYLAFLIMMIHVFLIEKANLVLLLLLILPVAAIELVRAVKYIKNKA